MAQPFVVTIPHRLGAEEAQRRMTEALDWFRENHGAMIKLTDEGWVSHGLAFQAGALGYSLTGRIDVTDTSVTLAADIPWLLQKMIGPFKDSFVEKARDHLQG